MGGMTLRRTEIAGAPSLNTPARWLNVRLQLAHSIQFFIIICHLCQPTKTQFPIYMGQLCNLEHNHFTVDSSSKHHGPWATGGNIYVIYRFKSPAVTQQKKTDHGNNNGFSSQVLQLNSMDLHFLTCEGHFLLG